MSLARPPEMGRAIQQYKRLIKWIILSRRMAVSWSTCWLIQTVRNSIKQESRDYPSLYLSQRQTCDLELLLNGGFSPLRGFMDKAAYEGVVERMQLPDGTLWPIPIVLDVSAKVRGEAQARNSRCPA